MSFASPDSERLLSNRGPKPQPWELLIGVRCKGPQCRGGIVFPALKCETLEEVGDWVSGFGVRYLTCPYCQTTNAYTGQEVLSIVSPTRRREIEERAV